MDKCIYLKFNYDLLGVNKLINNEYELSPQFFP